MSDFDKITHEAIVEKTLTNYEFNLKKHDWFFAMSDDHGVWKVGHANYLLIRDQYEYLLVNGKATEARDLWNKYAPDCMTMR